MGSETFTFPVAALPASRKRYLRLVFSTLYPSLRFALQPRLRYSYSPPDVHLCLPSISPAKPGRIFKTLVILRQGGKSRPLD